MKKKSEIKPPLRADCPNIYTVLLNQTKQAPMNNYQFLLQISQGMELPFLTRVDELKDITGHPFWLGTIHILRQYNLQAPLIRDLPDITSGPEVRKSEHRTFSFLDAGRLKLLKIKNKIVISKKQKTIQIFFNFLFFQKKFQFDELQSEYKGWSTSY